jgi:hypothetical protein
VADARPFLWFQRSSTGNIGFVVPKMVGMPYDRHLGSQMGRLGALKVIAAGEPERVYLCHCKACQRRTGTAFHFGVTYRRARVRLEGEYKIYERDADSGSRIRFYFCPTCGSNLRWKNERNPTLCGVAGGALENFDLSPTSAIFEESLHRWLELPSVTKHHRQGRSSAAS